MKAKTNLLMLAPVVAITLLGTVSIAPSPSPQGGGEPKSTFGGE